MSQDLSGVSAPPEYTLPEIARQPTLWPITVERVRSDAARLNLAARFGSDRVLITGAGSSAYAATAIALAWPQAMAVPTTDLLVDAERSLENVGVVVSLARSGDSPESAAVVERIRGLRPEIHHLAIVCNRDGALSRAPVDDLIALDPLTNDRSLVMTSSFSNLVLAGLALAEPDAVAEAVVELSSRAAKLFPEIQEACRQVAKQVHDRVVVLCSSPLQGWAQEGGLKILEMTAGRFPTVAETFLGLRHGPMSFVQPNTVVLCLLSHDLLRRSYELDLIEELRAKRIGNLVGIAAPTGLGKIFDQTIPAIAPQVSDALRTPYEIMIPQLLGYFLSLRIGLNPDRPSPNGIINRVVHRFRIHSGSASTARGS